MKHEKADRCHFSRSGDLGLRSALYSRCRIVRACICVCVCHILSPNPLFLPQRTYQHSNRDLLPIESTTRSSRFSIRSILFVLVLDL